MFLDFGAVAEIPSQVRQGMIELVQGALMRDRGLLQEARMDLARYQTLSKQDSISLQQVQDQAALVKQDEGIVKLDDYEMASRLSYFLWSSMPDAELTQHAADGHYGPATPPF